MCFTADAARALADEFLEKARHHRDDPAASYIWRDAAAIVLARLNHGLDEVLTIQQAARAYGWNEEALRRKVSADPRLNAGRERQPSVMRRTMEERIGYGRGPRKQNRSTGPGAGPASTGGDSAVQSDRFHQVLRDVLVNR